jgi:structural maintenance of chromosome 3 (chondroitin sulfate proteoglycan 6)
LDKKTISKNEVANLLESAGFSRANPYYIVQQGKIMAMSNMKDTERLALLKEIGGTGVYEERRRESLKVMEDTETRRTQIEETMSVIEAKLKELDDERQELAEYILLDKQRRSIEYSLVDADLVTTRADMAKLEDEQIKARESSKKVEEEAARAASERDEVEKNVARASAQKLELERQRKQVKGRIAELARSVASAEGEVHDLEAQVKRGEEGVSRVQKETGKLASDIKEAQAKLASAKSSHAKAEAEELKIRGQLDAAETRLKQLYERQGRDKSFASQKERDAWLTKEIAGLEGTLGQEEKRVRGMEGEAKGLQDRLSSFSKELADKEADSKSSEESSNICEKKLQELRSERDTLQNGRKEAWRIEAELRVKVEAMQTELKKRKANLDSHIARDISRGLQGLDKVVMEHKVTGVHGRLIDLIECPAQLSTAVEVTAGNSLFHIVVESDEVALRCSELLNRGKLGRVTFMPLNTLQPSDMTYPTEYGSDVVPLAKKVKCDQK